MIERLIIEENTKIMKLISTLFTSMFILISGYAYSGVTDEDPPGIHVESMNKSLLELGYEAEMIYDLFGDEFFYFPKTDSELDLTFYIVEKIIDNRQYNSSERDKLKQLASDGYNLYKAYQSEHILHETN